VYSCNIVDTVIGLSCICCHNELYSLNNPSEIVLAVARVEDWEGPHKWRNLWSFFIYAGNTVEQMLIGKQFNRAVRGFTLVFYSLKIIHIAAFINRCRTLLRRDPWRVSGTVCLISINISTNIREIFTWLGIFLPGCMIKEKLSNVSSWYEQMMCERCYKSRCTFGQITSEAALKEHIPSDPNLDCLTCGKTPYSITIIIQMAKRKGFATTGILWRTVISRLFARSCMFM
jgi:hypothetical protein